MSNPRYRVSINGFWCHNETWDDSLNQDGKHDEVFLSVNTKVLDANGGVLENLNSESELMGDTWGNPWRVQAGSASDRGGIVSGDKFPWAQPMIRQNGLNTTVRVPPYATWEGELPPGRMVFLTPTIWEWDPGSDAWDGWLDWLKQTDEKYGQRAKEIFGNVWPVSKPVFDAVSLGIQTFASLAGLWSPFGQARRRPIGLQRDPANPEGALFNPYTIALNAETAQYLVTSNPQGHGDGIRELLYIDDSFLRGVYAIFVQIEHVGSGGGVPIPGRPPTPAHVLGVNTAGRVWHTVRLADGSWLSFGDVEGQTGDIGDLTQAAAGAVGGELHVLGVNTTGGLYHTVRRADGSWPAFGDVEGQAGDIGRISQITTAAVGGELHVLAVNAEGLLYHTVRRVDGSWLPFGDVEGQTGDIGRVSHVTASAIAGELHVLAVPHDGRLLHTIRRADGTWQTFGDVEGQAGDIGALARVAAAAIDADLHVLAANTDGRLYHTIRRADGSWLPFGDVEGQTGNIGDVAQVAAAAIGADLHALAVPSDGRLLHTIRRTDGSWQPFGDVEGQTGDIGDLRIPAISGQQ